MCSLAQTLLIIHPQKGISGYLETAFSGVEIKDGVLHSKRELPYNVPSYLVSPMLNLMFGTPIIFSQDMDSFIVVDTSGKDESKYKIPVIIVKSDYVRFILNTKSTVDMPYRSLFLNKGNLVFTAENIRDFLLANCITIFMSCLLFNNFQNFFLMLFSIFFLAIAAFIFRNERERRYLEYLKIACFAVSTMCVGTILIAFAGVRIAWVWHVLIFFSTIVMIRAVAASGTINTTKGGVGDDL